MAGPSRFEGKLQMGTTPCIGRNVNQPRGRYPVIMIEHLECRVRSVVLEQFNTLSGVRSSFRVGGFVPSQKAVQSIVEVAECTQQIVYQTEETDLQPLSSARSCTNRYVNPYDIGKVIRISTAGVVKDERRQFMNIR